MKWNMRTELYFTLTTTVKQGTHPSKFGTVHFYCMASAKDKKEL